MMKKTAVPCAPGKRKRMSAFLDAFEAKVKESGANVFCVGEALRGEEMQLRQFVQTNPCQDVYSVSKAFTS
jgi:hypothetical protein